jgi:hypothetical protein
MKNKKFDCVDMKHRAAVKIAEKLKGLSRKAELTYWHISFKNMTSKIYKKNSKQKVA